MQQAKAFTLIELLIVVAIIAILAAIAVPNFLEAQTRSKVSRVKADMRTVATGIEAYSVDWNEYPPMYDANYPGVSWGTLSEPPFHARVSSTLTTPVSYLTSLPSDPFRANTAALSGFLSNVQDRQVYFSFPYFIANPAFDEDFSSAETFRIARQLAGQWLMYSVGPDNDEFNEGGAVAVYRDYDPTNGTISLGNIFRTQASGEGLGVDEYFYP